MAAPQSQQSVEIYVMVSITVKEDAGQWSSLVCSTEPVKMFPFSSLSLTCFLVTNMKCIMFTPVPKVSRWCCHYFPDSTLTQHMHLLCGSFPQQECMIAVLHSTSMWQLAGWCCFLDSSPHAHSSLFHSSPVHLLLVCLSLLTPTPLLHASVLHRTAHKYLYSVTWFIVSSPNLHCGMPSFPALYHYAKSVVFFMIPNIITLLLPTYT